ncbi:MAG TPA: glycosyltransferase family 2 protein [Acidimicrobiales bacterium]|jgi:glycosyltransferase involved in cell wall biosynthesis|nr:glycosyltransferase family 2 protein [Acidimicrobiales bacterium]HVE27564.1 glycosyltransferase family 2 protein [Sporichthya sp.]
MTGGLRPLVTIGIPTFNRIGTLPRAVGSALRQTYGTIEVVISDNASTDGTGAYAAALAAADDRVRYLRLERNMGALANFEHALRAARGEYFMWLGDDDWIDLDYLERCVPFLQDDPSLQLVAGRAHYYAGDVQVLLGEVLDLLQPEPWKRALGYYRGVRLNGVIYGLGRTDSLRELLPLRHSFGRDWMMCASLAYRGRVRTLTTTRVHRTVGGMSSDPNLLGQVGLGAVAARLPYTSMLAGVFTEVVRAPAYAGLAMPRRLALASGCCWLCLIRVSRIKLGTYRDALRRRPSRPAPSRSSS